MQKGFAVETTGITYEIKQGILRGTSVFSSEAIQAHFSPAPVLYKVQNLKGAGQKGHDRCDL